MQELGTLFTDRELQAASTLYQIPIVVFSPLNKMAFFDKYFSCETKDEPLYLLDNCEAHFEYLLHHDQKKQIRNYIENGF